MIEVRAYLNFSGTIEPERRPTTPGTQPFSEQFNHHQHDKQAGNVQFSIFPDKKIVALVFAVNQKKPGNKTDNRVVVGVDMAVVVAFDIHFYASKNKQGTEKVQYPFELLNKGSTDKNKEKAKNNSAEDSPKKDAVVINFLHTKWEENH